MVRRVRWKVHARREVGENPEMASKDYLSPFYYQTKMQNVAGLSNAEAQKSSDMYMKCQYMDELTNGKGIVFATGTPLSNSMVELYTNMRYLQSDLLKKYGLDQFDAWAANFGNVVTTVELAPEGYTFLRWW